MIQIILIAISMMIAAPAFAIHAYRSENCKSATHHLVYKGNYPIGGAFGLSKLNSQEEVEIWEQGEDNEDDENLFEIVKAKVLSSRENKAECGSGDGYAFSETVSKSQIVIQFTKLSKQAEKQTGIQSGTKMKFNCVQTFSTPAQCQ